MKMFNLLPITLFAFLLITLISGRALDYDQLNTDDSNDSASNSEDDEFLKIPSKFSNVFDEKNQDDISFDSFEEKQYHERSLFSSSRAPLTISTHTRQELIDLLQKALDKGWRPNLRIHIPATRFGRHRR